MKKDPLVLTLAISGGIAVACWLLWNGVPENYWGWRRMVVMVSGVVLAVLIAVCTLLALRPAWPERLLGGLDKLYAAHKRFGIACGIMIGVHWLAELSPKLFLAMQWAEPRVRKAGGGGKDAWVSLAKDMGEWAAWGMLGMAILALISLFPYRLWRPTHRLFAPLVLMGAWHGLLLFDRGLWLTPVGWLLALALLVSTYAAVVSLVGRIGRTRRFQGQVSALEALPGQQLAVHCRMKDWPGHAAGQFALVTFDRGEGAHPFTIASAERADGELRFIIKALGDYTSTLASRLQVGASVQVEGPYGCFVARPEDARSVWVAGGIGVTPFLAWLEAREQTPSGDAVDFYYCVRNARDAAALDEVRMRAAAAGVRLHIIESDAGQRFDPQCVLDVDHVHFCGPKGLGEAIGKTLAAHGQGARFHHEAFSMR